MLLARGQFKGTDVHACDRGKSGPLGFSAFPAVAMGNDAEFFLDVVFHAAAKAASLDFTGWSIDLSSLFLCINLTVPFRCQLISKTPEYPGQKMSTRPSTKRARPKTVFR